MGLSRHRLLRLPARHCVLLRRHPRSYWYVVFTFPTNPHRCSFDLYADADMAQQAEITHVGDEQNEKPLWEQ